MNALSMYIDGWVIGELHQLAPLAIDRLLKGLEDIEGQAAAVGSAAWKEHMGAPAIDEDPGIADALQDADDREQEIYDALTSLRQGAINLIAVWLYQLYQLHERDYITRVRKRSEKAVEMGALSTWARVDELKNVANTVKHGEDRDGLLRKLRPDLFVDPLLTRFGVTTPVKQVRMPLGGDGPFLTVDMLNIYVEDVVNHWRLVQAEHDRLNP